MTICQKGLFTSHWAEEGHRTMHSFREVQGIKFLQKAQVWVAKQSEYFITLEEKDP